MQAESEDLQTGDATGMSECVGVPSHCCDELVAAQERKDSKATTHIHILCPVSTVQYTHTHTLCVPSVQYTHTQSQRCF